jgi:3-hydroxyisobutyrate dehydrogenase
MKRIAVLGLGIMGGGIAANIVKSGYETVVWNRSPEKGAPLLAAGAAWAASPAEAARGADLVLACVGDDAASRAVWLGGQGALAAMSAGALAVECSTLSLGWVREWHAVASGAGLAALDAPLTGSKAAAAGGQLTLLVGGEQDQFDRALSVFRAFSANIFRFGPATAGAIYKLINNLLAASQLAALGEGLAMMRAAGLDMAAAGQVITTIAAFASPIVKGKAPNGLAHSHDDVHFALKWMHKDVAYAMQLAAELGVAAPANAVTLQAFATALGRGLGDKDVSAVLEVAG